MTTSPNGRLLLACLRGATDGQVDAALTSALRTADLSSLADEAQRQRVTGALFDVVLRCGGLDESATTRLSRTIVVQLASHLLVVAELATIATALRSAGLSFAAIKGPVLSEHVYPSPSWRSYADLDLLVAPADAVAARAAMLGIGAAEVAMQRSLTARGFDGEIALVMPSGLFVDLHHDLVNDASVRASFTIPTGELINRARDVDLGGVIVPALDATDQLLHLCVHAAISDGRKFVWLLDIDQAVRRDPPDWRRFVERAAQWKVALPVAVMLDRARTALDTPLPSELLDELAPNAWWRTICHHVLRLRPAASESTAMLAGGLVVASTRATSAQSAREFGRAAWRAGVLAPLRDPEHPWRTALAR